MAIQKKRLLRVSTIPLSLKMFCKELLCELKDEYDILAVSSSGSELDELRDCGIPVKVVEMSRNISIGRDICSLWQLIRLMREYRPDVVHSLTPKAGLLCMVAAWLTRVPVRIHSFTGLIFPTAKGLKRLILQTTDRITCACATHVLPEGLGVAHDLSAAGVTSKSLEVLGHGNLRGIDLSYYCVTNDIKLAAQALRHEMGIEGDDLVFVFVGRVVNDKGITELVEAYTRLSSQYGHLHLLLVGSHEANEDPLSHETLSTIDTMPNIHHINRWIEDVRPYYAMADALVFPSYREGFPNVVLEAGAMCLPSIVTDINGSREIIRQDVNGIIVPPHDADALYSAMRVYVDSPDIRARHSSTSRQMIADRYEASYVRGCLKDYYVRVIGDRLS